MKLGNASLDILEILQEKDASCLARLTQVERLVRKINKHEDLKGYIHFRRRHLRHRLRTQIFALQKQARLLDIAQNFLLGIPYERPEHITHPLKWLNKYVGPL